MVVFLWTPIFFECWCRCIFLDGLLWRRPLLLFCPCLTQVRLQLCLVWLHFVEWIVVGICRVRDFVSINRVVCVYCGMGGWYGKIDGDVLRRRVMCVLSERVWTFIIIWCFSRIFPRLYISPDSCLPHEEILRLFCVISDQLLSHGRIPVKCIIFYCCYYALRTAWIGEMCRQVDIRETSILVPLWKGSSE